LAGLHHLYAVNNDGSLRWRYKTDDVITSSPAIDKGGTIYVGSWDHHLYAINVNSPGYQLQSPWPAFHFNGGQGKR